MSILLESDNCILISHQNYIKEIYREISNIKPSNSFKLKSELFEINSPFKEQTIRKRKHKENLDKYESLREDSKYVQEKYEKFMKILRNEGFFIYKEKGKLNNQSVLKCAEKILEVSGENLLSNSVGKNESEKAIVMNLTNNDYLFPSNCEFIAKNVTEISENLTGKFHTILLDPPWTNRAIKRKRMKLNNGYQSMNNDSLKQIPIEDYLQETATVFVWCTNSPTHLTALTHEIFPKWGLEFIGKWFWLKVTDSGEPIINFTEPPGKLPFEQIVIGARNPTQLLKDSIGKVIVSVPSGLHSHKPPLGDVFKGVVGDEGRKLEVFARYLLPGWTSYGLEVLRLQNKCLYESYGDNDGISGESN